MKIKRPEWQCKGCLWITSEKLCPFARCVRYKGFVADKNKKVIK